MSHTNHIINNTKTNNQVIVKPTDFGLDQSRCKCRNIFLNFQIYTERFLKNMIFLLKPLLLRLKIYTPEKFSILEAPLQLRQKFYLKMDASDAHQFHQEHLQEKMKLLNSGMEIHIAISAREYSKPFQMSMKS